MNDHNNIPGGTADGGAADEYRDGELAAELNAERAPQHGPSFWSDLQANLDAEAAMAAPGLNGASRSTGSILEPSAEATTVVGAEPTTEMATAKPSGQTGQTGQTGQAGLDATAQLPIDGVRAGGPADDMVNVVSLDGRRSRSRAPMLLSAAAAVLLVAIGAVALISRSDDATSIQSADQDELDAETVDPDETEAQPDESVEEEGSQAPSDEDDVPAAADEDLPELLADYFVAPTTTVIADASFVGFSPDDSSVLLLTDVTTGETGCEGAPLLELFSQSLATGERVRAWPEEMLAETGGLDIKLADPNAEGGTVYIAEFCDGFRGTTWEAMMSSSGIVTNLVPIDAEGLSDPFTTSGIPSAEAVGARVLSPDLRFGAFIEDQQLAVRSLDDSGDEWIAPQGIVADDVDWDPTGQVLAMTSEDGIWFWNFRTGESALVPSATRYWSVSFDRSGTQLALTSSSDLVLQQVSIMTFGETPIPVGHVPTETPGPACSGDVGLAPLDPADLVAAGVAGPVAEKAAEIDRGAATCDWDALGEQVGPDFTASFGGGDPIGLWQDAEQNDGVMDTLRTLLRQPFSVTSTDEVSLYTWPAVFAREGCADYTDEDRQSLSELGYSDDDIASECDAVGGYLGYRIGFDEAGNWLYFVAGD